MKFVSGRWLFDGAGGVRDGGCVVVDGDRIVAVEDHLPSDVPPDAVVINVENGFLMPGFVDAHNHLGLGRGKDEWLMAQSIDEITARARKNAEDAIKCGVTTMRELGERDYLDFRFRKEIADGLYKGPRLLTAGPWITATHGHGAWKLGADIADGPWEVIKAVRAHIHARVDWVKLMVSGGIADSGDLSASFYSREELAAGVNEAHNYGVPVSVHLYGGLGARMCAEVGVDTIEHASRITDPSVLELFAKKGISVVYTDGTVHGDARIRDTIPISVKNALAAGVNVALGADTLHGRFPFEAECAIEHGASAMQALIMMTSAAAKACAFDQEVGTLQPGKRADMVIANGNPLENMKALYDLALVMKDGVTVAGSHPTN
jgi:imidazolonepropionase-like amidohydrolase